MPDSICEFPKGGKTERDPIHQHSDGSWWFYVETWADEYGPYPTYDDCGHFLDKYVRDVLGGA